MKQTTKNSTTRLFRSDDNIIAGVCGGLGIYFQIDPTIFRILFLILAFFGGSGIILYLILWIIVPSKKDVHMTSSDAIRGNVKEMKLKAKEATKRFNTDNEQSNKSLIAIILVILGAFFLFDNFQILQFDFGKFWPFLLIILGLLLLRRR